MLGASQPGYIYTNYTAAHLQPKQHGNPWGFLYAGSSDEHIGAARTL